MHLPPLKVALLLLLATAAGRGWGSDTHSNIGHDEDIRPYADVMEEPRSDLGKDVAPPPDVREEGEEIAVDMQVVERGVANSTLELRLLLLERHQAEADALLHVHGALLYELQTQLRNLSAAAQRIKRTPACTANIVRTAPLFSMQGALHAEVQHPTSYCPVDCASLYHNGVHRSGVYTIIPSLGGAPLQVYCDMETEGGGWTLFQRRQDGSVNFNRGWREYRQGFGQPGAEHWLGNAHIHLLTNQAVQYSLRIDLEDWAHKHRHALYHSFRIDNERKRYLLHVAGFSGTAEDSFGWYHDNKGFSTPDTGDICAEISHAGWWFHQCFYANLNGVYYKGGQYSLKGQNLLGPDGIVWFSWKDSDFYSLKAVSMMIRPRNFRQRLSP